MFNPRWKLKGAAAPFFILFFNILKHNNTIKEIKEIIYDL